ncbi:hypothetical protein [Paraburkholderia sediminicola]|uniref:hypothetical protein n=1 Tax=Paraburkholderia sediminicola TaxID=458836 RepID=UPI0038BC8FE2
MGTTVNRKKFWRTISWYLACVLNRVEWQHIAATGLLVLWATLIGTIDWPLHAETRQITLRLARHAALEPATPRPAAQQLAPRDLTHEFIRSLPKFEKYAEQIRELNLLAEKSSVVIVRVDYRYEQMTALPIKKLTLRMDVTGDEAQQHRFLQTTLNAIPNLSVARLAFAKSADGATTKVEQKLDVNLYYQLPPKASA